MGWATFWAIFYPNSSGHPDVAADLLRNETEILEGKMMKRFAAYSRAGAAPKQYVQDQV
jgi:hypothetical protein